MDERVEEDLTALGDGGRLQNKESEYIRLPENRNVSDVESLELRIPSESDYTRGSCDDYEEFFEAQNHVSDSSPRLMNEEGLAVEELSVRSFNGSDLAIVGTSINSSRAQLTQAKPNQWGHLYQLARSNSGKRSTNDVNNTSFSEFLAQKVDHSSHSEVVEGLKDFGKRVVSDNYPDSIRTKILLKSGFSEFFVKKSLKGKGVIFKGPTQASVELKDQNSHKIAVSEIPQIMDVKIANPSFNNPNGKSKNGDNNCDGITMREWMMDGRSQTNKTVRLAIFRQIVEVVDYSHSQGIALPRLRPTYFKLLPSYKIQYLGSPDKNEILQSMINQDRSQSEVGQARKRLVEQNVASSIDSSKRHRLSQNIGGPRPWLQLPSNSSFGHEVNIGQQMASYQSGIAGSVAKQSREVRFSNPLVSKTREQIMYDRDLLEENWYASPEQLHEGNCHMFSNIYSLGVFLFELLADFDSDSQMSAAMLDLRYRILPPSFLSKNPKEAGLCIWQLHPVPSSRPSTREILRSEVLNSFHEACSKDISASIEEDDCETDLLMHFLASLKEQKEKNATKLVGDIHCLEEDVKEIMKRTGSYTLVSNSKKQFSLSSVHALSQSCSISDTSEPMVIKNIDQLENAYFSMRAKIQLPETETTLRQDNELLRNHENWSFDPIQNDRVGTFFDGLCKYARYSRFEVRGLLRNGEFNNSLNVICSLSFDRDEDYFAAAGVSKKIKIFDYNSLLNESVDIHYPTVEMENKSKLSCVCWNGYIKNYLASTDYDGAVKLWDSSTGQTFHQFTEHEKRAWSVDFSQVYPTKLASGSDDCSVKLWSINEKNCLGTIKSIANVCCVTFSTHSSNLLAFGSADYRTYCYDLRYARTPWCVLAGHEKAVSYVKFLDSETLISASTDNTLKMWDLNKTTSSGLSSSACSLTLRGHTNEKNFVGLSVADGYIACGSESNEVYAYHRSLPMPITSHKFGSIDPISGKETDNDNGQFVSCVCWRAKSETVIAANSTGCIKALQMV